jgi:hypothetical protein
MLVGDLHVDAVGEKLRQMDYTWLVRVYLGRDAETGARKYHIYVG